MSDKRYTDEFKAEAAKQVIDQGRSVREVSTRLGISIDSLYAWVRTQRKVPAIRQADASLASENRRLQGCGKHRVARLMKGEGLRAQVGYGRRPRPRGGRVSTVAPNTRWVTDITYIRTHEGWLYLAVVLDLYSRQVVGWAMQVQMHADLVLQALLAAVWRRKPTPGLMLHSDQGSQFTGSEWQAFLKAHGIVCSMSRRGNCHDNAVAESFFQLLKRERIKRKIYLTRDAARSDVFDYIEMFYNPKRRHGSNGGVSPVELERQTGQSGL